MTSKKITVLLVDDDSEIQAAYKAAFEAFEISIIQAMSGKEALEILSKQMPGIILLDILMPEMNGLEFLEIIKKNPAYADIPVIVISNSVKEEDMARAVEMGALEYIIKSNISITELIEKTKQYAATV